MSGTPRRIKSLVFMVEFYWLRQGRASFDAATPWALRRSAVTGSCFGARGTASSLRPAPCGRRSALRWFTSIADQTREVAAVRPAGRCKAPRAIYLPFPPRADNDAATRAAAKLIVSHLS
jgi:hypothetical protein